MSFLDSTLATQSISHGYRQTNGNSELNQLLRSIKADTAATRADITSTRKELKGEIQLLAQNSDTKFNAIDAQLSHQKHNLSTLFTRVKQLERSASSSGIDIELQKQLGIRNNISISNIPSYENENLFDIIKIVLSLIGINKFEVKDLANAKRVAKSKSKLIIASFADYGMKLEVMKKKTARSIMVSDLFDRGDKTAGQRVYINTQLTPFYSNLSFRGRDAAANKLIYSSWISNSGFLVKLDEDSSPILIANEAQFDSLLAANNRVIQKKRNRSADINPSPSSLRAAKQPALRKISTDINDMGKAAEAMNISGDDAQMNADGGGGDGVTCELDTKQIQTKINK